jgi:hypothetical protein
MSGAKMTGVTNKPVRYVGNPDFHDGYIRSVSQNEDKLLVTIEGSSGKHYTVGFEGVSSVESHSPQDMMLYALSEADAEGQSLRHYDFINWYFDEPEKEESNAYLRIVANRFTVTESD